MKRTFPQLRVFLAILLITSSTLGLSMALNLFGGKDDGEYIIISGGPALAYWEGFRPEDEQHDKWWGNFVRTARVRMVQLRKENPNLDITWLVFREGYELRSKEDGVDHISNVISVRDRDDVKCKLVWYNSTDELINYINSGPAGRSRDNYKIVGFEYFGHSNKYCFTFDYSGSVLGASKVFLHEEDLSRFKKSAFARGATAVSWGCHTGESMSQAFRSATGVRMKGAIGKTDYSKIYLNGGSLPRLSPGGKWSY